jgi:8-oxo-dGTP pyrophosphatase MutT (NUDIX family)
MKRFAVVWLLNSRGEVALQLRSHLETDYPLCWDFSAGGNIDGDETPEEAVIRELREEIGVTAPVELEFIARTKNIYPDDLTIYRARYDGRFTPDLKEVDEVQSFPVDEIKRMIKKDPKKFHPDVVFFFERYKI